MSRVRGALAVVLLLAFAGCAKQDAEDVQPTPETSSKVEGVVLDPAIKPVAGAKVKLLETNANTTTDEDGHYEFVGVPVERVLILVAEKAGYKSSAAQVSVSVDSVARLNFTLIPEPVKTPYHDVLPWDFVLQCQLATSISQQNETYECGSAIGEQDQWEFSVGPDFAGAIVEAFWEPQTPAGESLGMRLDTLNLGELNRNLGQIVGTSGIRITVPNSVAVKYYPEGGQMRLQMFAAANNAENEVGVGASLAFQQTVHAYASVFYVQPPDQSYTIANP